MRGNGPRAEKPATGVADPTEGGPGPVMAAGDGGR